MSHSIFHDKQFFLEYQYSSIWAHHVCVVTYVIILKPQVIFNLMKSFITLLIDVWCFVQNNTYSWQLCMSLLSSIW